MEDHTISFNTLFAWSLWTLGILLVAVDLISSVDLDDFGVIAAAAGATLHVRGMICGLGRRERAAYDLGRESVRSVR